MSNEWTGAAADRVEDRVGGAAFTLLLAETRRRYGEEGSGPARGPPAEQPVG